MHEVLQASSSGSAAAFEKQFKGMSDITFTYEDFESTRKQLIEKINSSLTETDRTFLLSFKRGNPDWDLFPVTRTEGYASRSVETAESSKSD